VDDPTSTPEVSQPHVVGPPTHRRSRWLRIAAVVVVLIGGLWWLTRPKIDPRFVGTWEFYVSESGNSDALGDRDFMGSVDFRPEGTATFEGNTKAWEIDAQGRLIIGNEAAMVIQRASDATIVLKVEGVQNRFVILKRASPADPVR
jgi:hypothetical protein